MKVLYTAVATATGGRNGHAQTKDGVLKFNLGMPVALGGKGEAKPNPEQLFACGYAACFGSAIEMVAKKYQHTLKEIIVTAHVDIGQRAQGGFGLAVQLDVNLPGLPHAEAQKIAAEAHQVCPYSNAVHGNIDVALNVVQSRQSAAV